MAYARKAVAQLTVDLEGDLKILASQAKRISEEYSTSITSLLGAIGIREAQRAINQGARMQQLTFLDLPFVPASLAAGLFSTNILELQKSTIWHFVLTFILLTLISILTLFRSEAASIYRYVRRTSF
ncbi:hypothetical protein GX50_02725 [[Emmonsia] crescens]|uniref:Uncharacterized protein n=1 Tax=[Emmonsia] crescens TaxID=73230 RepID=A0A2B7ZNV1_9EURO|nr:hypothetical protein GX50_02725 [Emmonsia crescens]